MADRRHPSPLACALALGLGCAGVAAQPSSTGAGGRWVTLDSHDDRRSRAAFKACDGDGDDRLDVREARRSLTGMGPADDLTGFQAIDSNRDGFLHWAEFDARFKRTAARGARFRFFPARPFSDPSAGSKTAARQIPKEQRAAELVVAMANVDDDPHISLDEFRGLLKALGQPPVLAASFGDVDLDKSGGLSQAEFVPVLSAVPFLAQLVLAQSAKHQDTMRPGDLSRSLIALHPGLQRWQALVFRQADKNLDGMLDKSEWQTTKKQPAGKTEKGHPKPPVPARQPAARKPGK